LKHKKLRILYRTSGGRAKKKELGLGHIYRCINLAHYLKKNQISFLLEDFGGAREVLNDNGFHDIRFLKRNITLNLDIKSTVKFIKEKRIDLVIVDNYRVKIKYLKELKKSTIVVVIADVRKTNYPADLLVNGFIGYKNKIIKNRYGSKCLLGPNFQILNKGFIKKEYIKKKFKILVTFGGFDEKNIAQTIAKELVNFPSKIKVKIIQGPVADKSNKITKIIKNHERDIKIVTHSRKMFYEIEQAEFGICSGGITTYEFAAMNVPFAIICDDKHQLLTAKEWQKKRIALNLGMMNKNIKIKIQKLFLDIVKNRIILKRSKVVDGFGAKRVSDEIFKIIQTNL